MRNHPARRRVSVDRAAIAKSHDHDFDYSALLIGVRAAFDEVRDQTRLFLTDATGLNDLYLDTLPQERQEHNCYACRRFIEGYGSLVAITEAGETIPVMWFAEGVPPFYRDTFAALQAKVKRARVTSVFLTKQTVWGTPLTGEWSHMAVNAPAKFVYQEGALTAGQAMAALKENFRTVATALREFKPAVLDQALRVLNADALARSEKFIGPVRWLRALHDRPKGRAGENVLWRAIAAAPEGYCHPKASVLAPLLADIVAGLPFDDIKVKFEAMLHPLRYQRPQAAPSAGNIKAAEALVAKLGIAPALERRFARIDELQTVWLPREAVKPETAGGVFAHIKPKNDGSVPVVDLPTVTITWEKFARTVLPQAERMDIRVPSHGNFEAYLTAANDDAPLIFKWGHPVSGYVYHGGSPAHQWALTYGSWSPVLAVSPRPNLWGEAKSYLGDGQLLVIKGAVDTRDGQGNALFPETLRDDLHGVRATIEAYSKAAAIGRPEGQLACGFGIGKGRANCVLRVFAYGEWASYQIDRWD
jgi:hypothetical protein